MSDSMMPYYVWVRNSFGWLVAKYYPKEKFYVVCGSEFDYYESDFEEIGERVEMPK